MLSSNDIKYIRSLQQKKIREEEKKFICEGEKMISELFRSGWKVELVCATEEWLEANDVPGKIHVEDINEGVLQRISGLSSPNKVLAIVHRPEFVFTPDIENKFLILDNISDPGNLGSIIRTADWFGIKTILCSEESVELFNPKVVQSTMGSIFRVKCIYGDLKDGILALKENGVTICGACMDGDNLFEYRFKQKSAVVMGSEAHGISNKVLRLLDEKITIPKSGETESLNVSVAAGIFCAGMNK